MRHIVVFLRAENLRELAIVDRGCFSSYNAYGNVFFREVFDANNALVFIPLPLFNTAQHFHLYTRNTLPADQLGEL